jgi:hypothetical protein
MLFEKDLCLHYVVMNNVANDDYYFLRKNIKGKYFYLLTDFSIPMKEKLISYLVLYPRLFNAVTTLYKRIRSIHIMNNKKKFNKK